MPYYLIAYDATCISKRWDRTMTDLESHGHPNSGFKLVEATSLDAAFEVVRSAVIREGAMYDGCEVDRMVDMTLRDAS